MLASKGADIGTGRERRRERGRTAAASGLRYSAFLRWLCRGCGCGCGCLGSLIVSLVYRGIPLPTAEPDLAVVGLRSIIRDPPAISSRRSRPRPAVKPVFPRERDGALDQGSLFETTTDSASTGTFSVSQRNRVPVPERYRD